VVYNLDGGLRYFAGASDFYFTASILTLAPTVFYQIDTKSSFPVVKWPRREADYSHPSNVEVKGGGAISLLPLYINYNIIFLLWAVSGISVGWTSSSNVINEIFIKEDF
jgi:hypothetical protein